MKILDVSPRANFPPTSGTRMRIYHLLRYLSRNHEVRQFCQTRLRETVWKGIEREVRITPAYREYRYTHPIQALANEWCQRSWHTQALFSGSTLRFSRPTQLWQWLRWADVTLVEQPWQFSYCKGRKRSGPIVLATQNVEVLARRSHAEAGGISTRNSFVLRHVKKMEQRAVSEADLVLAVSPQDRLDLIDLYRINPDRVVEIPNGTDCETFVPAEPQEKGMWRRKLRLPDKPTVIYLASNRTFPHQAGLSWVRRLARRMRDFTFVVVGGIFPFPSTEYNLIATGVVDDISGYLKSSDFSLCPIQYGGGTKIKVWDSLAAGLPTVLFEETICGTNLRHGEEVWAVDKDEKALESALRNLWAEPTFAARLGAKARSFVVERHDWSKIAGKLERVLVKAVESWNPRP